MYYKFLWPVFKKNKNKKTGLRNLAPKGLGAATSYPRRGYEGKIKRGGVL
jgi:hypothetical protein